jgi:hypothetical protein
MKELSIEEKQKTYDEAIRKLRGMMPNWERLSYNGKTFLQDLIHIFPELKESEDERIRKEIISFLQLPHPQFVGERKQEKWIAWLENQEEQKPTDKIQLGKKYKCIASPRYSTFMVGQIYKPEDKFLCSLMNFCYDCFELIEGGEKKSVDKIEPKFKVGDWIVYREGIWKIGNIALENYYELLKTNNEVTTRSIKEVDENAHLWTIQDAKDGDVLADDYGIYIFDRFDEYDERCFLCMGAYQYSQKVFKNEHMLCSVEVHPATKEQRELLFQKMYDAGYTFNFEKKELKKIHIIDEGKAEMDYCFTKMMNGEKVNTVWSEEDEKNISTIRIALRDAKLDAP